MVTCRIPKCLYHDSNYNMLRYVGDILGHSTVTKERRLEVCYPWM